MSAKYRNILNNQSFPSSSARKESACNAGDPGPIPGLGRPPAEGISYPLNSWTSLMTQMVKNLPAMKETWVRSMGWEDPPWRRAWQHTPVFLCFPGGLAGICLQCGRPGFHPWVGKIPWRREWLPTPVFWPV